MKKSEIILVVLALLAGLVIHLFKSEKIDRISEIFKPAGELSDQTHVNEFTGEEKIFSNINSLAVDNPAGFILIQPSADNTTTLKTTYKIYHRQKEDARRIREKLKVMDHTAGDTVSVKIQASSKFPLRRARVYMSIQIPPKVELRLSNRYGDITALHVAGGLYIRNHYGNIKVNACRGILEIFSHHGKDVEISNVPHARVHCLHSTLSLSNISKGVDIYKSFNSNIKIKKSNNINIQSTHTHINMEEIHEAMNISGTHATIILEKCNGDLKVMARDCHIKLKEITSGIATIKNSYRNTDIKGISAKNLSLFISHGNLDLDFKEISDSLNAKGIHANITMRYPTTLSPAFNLRSLYGHIINKTRGEMEILRENQTYSLTTTGGRPEIILSTTYGDIVLKNNQ